MKPSVQAIALLDQVEAAGAQLAGAMRKELNNLTEISPQDAHPVVRQLVNNMMDRCANGKTGMCEHLSPQAPAPAFWRPDAPGLIRCASCHMRLCLRQMKTPADYLCDKCGHDTKPGNQIMNLHALMLPGFVFDVPGRGPVAFPPIGFTCGLCSKCDAV